MEEELPEHRRMGVEPARAYSGQDSRNLQGVYWKAGSIFPSVAQVEVNSQRRFDFSVNSNLEQYGVESRFTDSKIMYS